MSDPAYALQIAMAAALLADDGVTGLVGANVFDDLSAPSSVYDRVTIGDDQVLPEPNGCLVPDEIYSTVHGWCRGADGRLKAKQLAGEVRRVLTVPLPLDGHIMTSALCHEIRYLTQGDATDPDGLVCHVVLTFRFHTYPHPA